jgi:hypothetical protein
MPRNGRSRHHPDGYFVIMGLAAYGGGELAARAGATMSIRVPTLLALAGVLVAALTAAAAYRTLFTAGTDSRVGQAEAAPAIRADAVRDAPAARVERPTRASRSGTRAPASPTPAPPIVAPRGPNFEAVPDQPAAPSPSVFVRGLPEGPDSVLSARDATTPPFAVPSSTAGSGLPAPVGSPSASPAATVPVSEVVTPPVASASPAEAPQTP